jgi:ribosomal-protein-alanine N-acetyltransferase
MSLVFRPMTKEDVLAVYEIETSLFPDPWPAASFLAEIRNDSTSFPFVIEKKKIIVGYSVCWYYIDELHIGNLAVRKSDQRKGVGRFLLEEIFNYFKEFNTAYLEVRETNLRAINLYAHFGFKAIYKRRNYYRNGEDALVMIKINE